MARAQVQQTFVVPDEDPWPEASRSMKLGSRVNAIRSHGTFLRRHPERRQRLVDLGLSLNEPEPAQNSGGAGSILDAVLKDTGKGAVDAWGLDFSGETAEAEEEERPRVRAAERTSSLASIYRSGQRRRGRGRG